MEVIRQLGSQLSFMGDRMSIHCQFELVVEKFFNYTSYLDLAYLKIKSFWFHLCH